MCGAGQGARGSVGTYGDAVQSRVKWAWPRPPRWTGGVDHGAIGRCGLMRGLGNDAGILFTSQHTRPTAYTSWGQAMSPAHELKLN